MNRYVVQGLIADARRGRRVVVAASRRFDALALFQELIAAADGGAAIRRTNGQEAIAWVGAGAISFHHAGAGLRGLVADVVFVLDWNNFSEDARRSAELIVRPSSGELLRS